MSQSTSFSSGREDKQRVKEATDIVDLVGSYLQLRRQGSMYVANCPWHDDHRPSLQVHPARQTWKCWVCDIHGDVFSFVMRRENVGFREALEILAERAGIRLTSRPQPKTVEGHPNDKPTLLKAMDWAAQQYQKCLRESPEAEGARIYLQQRGITQAAIDQFKIGFAPNQWSWLLDLGKSTNFSPEVLAACGLVSKNQRSDGWYERFRGRIMFPIFDLQDRPIAFGGRILPEIAASEEASQDRPPAKYINSPETKLYSKADNLFGLNLARASLNRDQHLIIVEGYTDVIGSWLAGIENVAAVCGTALGPRQIQIIKRFANEITLVLDGDEAGQRRTNELLELFIEFDVDLRILILPDGSDPFDYLQDHGANEFRHLVNDAVDALQYKIEAETRGVNVVHDTHRANRALENILRTMAAAPVAMASSSGSRMRQQQVLTQLAQRFQVELETLRHRLDELRVQAKSRSRTAEPSRPAPTLASLRSPEKELIQILLRAPALKAQIIENISPDQFVPGPCRDIYELVCQCVHDGSEATYDNLMVQLESPELKNLLDQMDEESQAKQLHTQEEYSNQLAVVISTFEQEVHRQDDRQARSQLSNPEIDDQEESLILEQLFQKTKQRQGL